jgi:hypothetical protein
MQQSYAKFRNRQEWEIIKFLKKQDGNLKTITEGVKSNNRDKTRELIDVLQMDGLLNIASSRKIGRRFENIYTLSANAKRQYFPESFELIGKAKDINEISKKAFDFYVQNDYFISLANQIRGKEKYCCDMIAYDYQNDIAISIEIESTREVSSHPEKVRFNMLKWKELGFAECHVWSKSQKITEIRDNLGNEAKLVKTFLVKD